MTALLRGLCSASEGNLKRTYSTPSKRHKAFLGPAIDGVFLKGPPEEVLKNKEFLRVPMLVGVVNHEFVWIMAQFFAPPGWVEGMERQSVVSVMDMFFPAYDSGGNELIVEEYLQHAKNPEDIRDAFTEILGDMVLVLPTLKVMRYH